MSDLEFQVVNARRGSEAQQKIGIMATFGLKIVVGGAIIAQLSDLNIKKGKTGTFIGSPQREYQTSKGERAWITYIKMFPEEKDGKSSKAIIDMVKAECENGSSNKQNNSNSNSNKAPVKPKTSNTTTSDW